MRKITLLIVSLTLISHFAMAQKVAITGTVTSKEDGLPVIGASVVEKGTTNGTITNLDGIYNLQVSAGATLVISYVGLEKQEKKVGNEKVINVVLTSGAVAIDEIVVTAMGVKQEKKKLNFAVQSMNSSELMSGQPTNFIQSLQGNIAGINVSTSGGSPNSGTNVILRAPSSINTMQGNQPLYIVDGMQSSSAANINPNDIENITVLKGAAASALYGQEAANGVIMITTKNGSEGKVSVNMNTTLQIDQPFHVPEIQQQYGPGSNGFYKDQTGGGWGPLLQAGEKSYDNIGSFLGNGFLQKYDVSASGGTGNFTAYVSGSHTRNDGIVPLDYNYKTNVLAKGTFKTKTLSIYLSVQSTSTQSRGFTSGAMSAIYNWPINDDMSNYKNADGSIRYRYLADRKQDSPLSPFWSRYEDFGKTETERKAYNTSIAWKPLKNLELTSKFSYDAGTTYTSSYTTPRFKKSDFSATDLLSVSLDEFGTFGFTQSTSKFYSWQNLATYKWDLTSDFSANFLLGSEMKSNNGLSVEMGGRDFTIPGAIYSMQNLNEAIVGADKDINMFRTQKNMWGVFGEARLEYKGIAHLNVTMRNDNSSTIDPDKRSYYYPSITGGLVFSEIFNLSNDIFSYGKLRGNWAKVGKDAPAYLFDRKFKSFPTYPDGGYGSDPTSAVAKKLSPEMTSSWEIGGDFRFFKNKTSIDVAYYSTAVYNQIVTVRVSPASGNILEVRNEGSVENRGLEATLTQEILNTKKLKWTSTLNFSYNRGRVVDLPDQLTEIQGTQYGDIFPTAYLNGSSTALTGKDYKRTSDGKIIVSSDGYPEISPAKANLIGNREPDFLLGLSSKLTYKDLTISVLFDTRKGGDVVNVTGRTLYSTGMHKNLELYRNREIVFDGVVLQSDGSYLPNTKPVIFDQPTVVNYFYAVSSNFIEDGSYIRLSFLDVSYNLTKFVKKTMIKDLKVGLTGKNLFLLTRYSGSDPQVNASPSAGGTGAYGIDNMNVPGIRSLTFNVNLTF